MGGRDGPHPGAERDDHDDHRADDDRCHGATAPAIGEVVNDLDRVAVGQCLYGPDMLDLTQIAVATVTVAACTSPHHAEVFHISELDAALGVPYPGDAAIEQDGDARCLFAFNGYVGTDYQSSRYSTRTSTPIRSSGTRAIARSSVSSTKPTRAR